MNLSSTRGKPREVGRYFTLIELMIVIAIIAIIAALAIPNLMSSRKSANESAALGAIKALQNAQVLFREGDADGNNTNDYATLTQLDAANLVDDAIAAGARSGYNLRTAPGTSGPTFAWWADAQPVIPGSTGDRNFATNHGGVILFNSTAPITIDTATAELSGGSPLQ